MESLNELKTCKELNELGKLLFRVLLVWYFPRYSAWFQFFTSVLNDCPFRFLRTIFFGFFFNRVTKQDNVFRSFEASLTMSIEESNN